MTTATTRAAARHPSFEHVALLHAGPEELAERLAPQVVEALAGGDAVLASLAGAQWRAIAARLGDDADRVAYLDVGRRYATPGAAMAAVHSFVTTAVAAGAPRVWSIGSIPFDGTDDDVRWMRYEAAADELLGDLPCRLVCAYDTSCLGSELIASASRCHRAVDADGHHRLSDSFAPVSTIPTNLATPSRPPDLDTAVPSSELVRRQLTALCRGRMSADRLADLHIVASELVTNGLRHGRPPVRFKAWCTPAQVVLHVSDAGDGVADPYPDLRPPKARVQQGGYGLWIVGQLADWFDVTHDGGRTVIRAAVRCSD